MNTSILLRQITNGLLVSAGLTLFAGVLPSSAAEPSPSDVRVKMVSLHGLDLTTAAGQEAAKQRLLKMAHSLCERVSDELDLSKHANFVKCVDAAMASSMPKVEALARIQGLADKVALNNVDR